MEDEEYDSGVALRGATGRYFYEFKMRPVSLVVCLSLVRFNFLGTTLLELAELDLARAVVLAPEMSEREARKSKEDEDREFDTWLK